MPQVIIKDNVIFCQTRTDYSPEVVKSIKSGGYKVKNVEVLPCDKEIVDNKNKLIYNE